MARPLPLGTLDDRDPLYEILAARVYPHVKDPVIQVSRMSSSRVYQYREEKSRIAVIGKFFRLDDTRSEQVLRIRGEYENLLRIRGLGFDHFPHSVVCPITREIRIGLAVAEEFVHGRDLDHFLRKAVHRGEHRPLKLRLTGLAQFLYSLHSKTEQESRVDTESVGNYFRKILNRLQATGVLSASESAPLLSMRDRWLSRGCLQEPRNAVVHGDATPTNFLFTEDGGVIAIDLERTRETDPAFDVGMVSGELKHAFLWRTGNPLGAEPFIHHFLRSYCDQFPDREKAFRRITSRVPFYMAMTELRIARNSYLDHDYRRRLSSEAFQCLKWGWRLFHEKGCCF